MPPGPFLSIRITTAINHASSKLLSDSLEALMRAKEMERKQKATEDIANHKKLVTEEIEMLKLCIAFGS